MGRGLRTGLLGLAAVLVALVVAPRLYAADDTPAPNGGAAQAQPADAPGTQATAPEASSSQAADQPAAGESTTPNASDGPSTPNASDGPSQANGPKSTAAAPDTGASSTPAASQGVGMGSGSEQDGSVGQGANAAATAHQQGVGNSQSSVKVDKPGNGPPVSQENQAAAGAEAAAAAETSAPVTSDQSAAAVAAAAQTDTQNTAVAVRVGSPGDNGAVEQANAAGATATTSVTAPETAESTVDQSAVAVATQDGVTNTNVSIRVFSPGNDGAVAQTNTAVAAADTSGDDGATAEATQNGVQNTNVSIRVGSPGTSEAVAQQSTASAGTGVAVSTTTNGLDTNLSVVVDGNGIQQPGANGLQVWEWTWNWDRDESVTADALLDTQPASWDWLWGSVNGQNGGAFGQVTSQTVGSDELDAGSWTWNWSWARAGAPNWTWQWNWAAQVSCASCIWIWNWTWNWTGQPVPTGLTPAPAQTTNSSGTPDQANVAVAEAQASVTAVVTQAIEQDGEGPGGQYAGQLVTVEQAADATAAASQFDVETVATANRLGAQVNRVVSNASATVRGEVEQHAEQTMLVDEKGEGAATLWSGQEVDLVQQAQADVHAVQRDVSLRTRDTVLAAAHASAAAAADVDQRVVQDALVDSGTTDQWAGQLTLVEQIADAAAVVEQTGTAASRSVGSTARAVSAAGALVQVDQGLVQRAARGGGLASQTAMQVVYVGQDGSTVAMTTQQVGGAASPLASSDASATNRALVLQQGVQESSGALSLDIQDLTQQSIVVQTAIAVSISAGGIAGRAAVANCAIVQQTAGQSVAGGSGSPAGQDLSAFCTPPALASSAEPESASSAVAARRVVVSGVAVAPPDDGGDVQLFHSLFHQRFSAAARRSRATTPRLAPVRSGIHAERPVTGAPASTQISVPRPTQARLDTRPGAHAGAGDAGTEPPLPPAGGPPRWVSALAAATGSGTGPSGIAAIPDSFLLVPPLLLRAREGSVVRRPIDALSQVDVPV